MIRYLIGLTVLVAATGAVADTTTSVVSTIRAEDINALPSTNFEAALANVPGISVDTQTGLSVRGVAQVEYRAWTYVDEFALGVNATLDYGFILGNGVAKVGVTAFGDYTSNAGNVNIDLRPFASYEWNQSKISVGNIYSSYDFINRPTNWSTSYIKDTYSNTPLAVRFDTSLGNARVSASYNEYNELSLGGTYPLNDTTTLYGAGITALDSDYYRASLGVLGNLGQVDYRVGFNCDSYGLKEAEVELAYDFNDRITGIGYVGAQSYGSNTDFYYNLGAYYHVNDNLDLFAGYEHASTYDDITIGAMFRFGAGQDRGPNDELIISLRPTLATARD